MATNDGLQAQKPDLKDILLLNVELELFMDVSASKEVKRAGYEAVTPHETQGEALPTHFSAQTVALKALRSIQIG